MTPWRRRIHHLRLVVQALFASAVILLGLIVGLVRLALPWIVAHPQKISDFLSQRLNRSVTIDRVEGLSESDGPVLILHGLHITSKDPAQPPSTIPRAELKVNYFSWLHRNQSVSELRLIGLDLNLVRAGDGTWKLHGLEAAAGADIQRGSSLNDNPLLFDLGSLVLRDLRLRIDDAVSNRHLVLSAPEVRLINSGDEHTVLARIYGARDVPAAVPVDIVIRYDSATRQAQLYAGGTNLRLPGIARDAGFAGLQLERGDGRVQVWGWWRNGRLMRARAEVDLADVVMATSTPIKLDAQRHIAPRVGFDRLAFAARWLRTPSGWRADVDNLVMMQQGLPAAPATIGLEKLNATAERSAPQFSLGVDDLNMAAPAAVAMLSDAWPASWRRWLYMADPQGRLDTARLRYTSRQDFDLSARFDSVAWHALDKLPGVSNLSASLLGDPEAFSLRLPPNAAFGVTAPQMFRQPLEFSQFSGDIAAYRTDASWRLETDAVDFVGAGYQGQLRGAIAFPDDHTRPFLDAYAVVTRGAVSASHLFWPINVMPPPAVSWLDRALAAGQVRGRAVVRGDLADWPFRNASGRFHAHAEVSDARIVYLPDWPAAEQVRASADFVDTSLHAVADAARASGNRVRSASANIEDLGEPVLELDVSGSGRGKNLLGFLRATPIGERYAGQLLGVDIGGTGSVDFHLHLPIKHSEQLDLSGSADLHDADLLDAQYALRLNQANGRLRFSQHGFGTDPLAVTVHGKPGTFTLAVGDFSTDADHAVEAALRAELPAGDLLAYAPALSAYADRIQGSTAWNLRFSADRDGVANAGQRLNLSSDLHGVAVDLPMPLRKDADSVLPLDLTLGLPASGGSIDLQLADLLHLRGRLASNTRPFAARVEFGGDASAPLPAAGFVIGGHVHDLNLSGWMVVSVGGGTGSDQLASVDLHAQSMRAWDRDFGKVRFMLKPKADNLDLGFDGARISGSLHIPTADLRRRGITAQFKRLYWPEAPESETSTTAGENPLSVPPLHVHIDDFHLGHSNFGEATVESYPTPNGAHFEQVSTHSRNVEMRAHGDWTGVPGNDRSTFSIDFTAHNLGNMLDAFGYAGIVDGGQTVAQIQGSWAGSPSTFALARLNGSLKVSVQEGRIPDAHPGAGRIFGLLNLSAIPRRLTLDFGDFFRSGLSFDSIEGTFMLKHGDAYTHDLKIKGPSADIVISGRTGLKAKDYDQTMQVTPHVGGTLAVGGALVGGPVGAAAGVVLQGIFKKQINAAARASYTVTGSWEKPKITLKNKEKVPQAQAADDSADKPPSAAGKPDRGL